MIRVTPAPEPEHFDAIVRQPGLRALAELAGEAPLPPRSGRPRSAVATTREGIPVGLYPAYWTEIIPDLLQAYSRICSYACLYIEEVTGAASVDHRLPKSIAWQHAYEWSNYRLACSLINSRKGQYLDVLDPFEIEDGWFQIELVAFQVLPNPHLPTEQVAAVTATIDRLGLNERRCLAARENHAVAYFERDITLQHLRKRAPFLARELERQGQLV